MMTALIVSQIITWILLLGLIAALLAVARQVGILHQRVAPAGALTPRQGPEVGTRVTRMRARALDGEHVEIGGTLPPGRVQMIFFVSAQCPLCKTLIPVAKSFARAENIGLVFAGDDEDAVQRKLVADAGLSAFPFVNDPLPGRTLAVDKLPHAVLLDAEGTILARGLVNSREQFESMMVSAETGLPSVQHFLETRARERAL